MTGYDISFAYPSLILRLSFAQPSLNTGAKPHQQALSKENTLAKKIFVKKIVQNKKKLYICTIKKNYH